MSGIRQTPPLRSWLMCGLAIARLPALSWRSAGIIPGPRRRRLHGPSDLPRTAHAELRTGLCASGEHDPDLWTSTSHAERCPGQGQSAPPARRWRPAGIGVSACLSGIPAPIWGGLGAKARIKLKRDRQVYAPVCTQAEPADALLGTCGTARCPGSNLYDRHQCAGRPDYRGCAWCRRRANRETARRRRGKQRSQGRRASAVGWSCSCAARQARPAARPGPGWLVDDPCGAAAHRAGPSRRLAPLVRKRTCQDPVSFPW